MGNKSFSEFVDRCSSLDIFVLLDLLSDEIQQNVISQYALVDFGSLGLAESNIKNLQDFVV